ncbi:MAG: NAD(P)/FAD-dependent oxidoreductase, partial [Methanosarcinales archaeon]|nr:NAD(P)/FAD-dependent oxidoreductase [Methanosarcinales archaeon]
MTNDYDVIIVGAGPAGMFAADELADSNLRVLVIDAGRDIGDRNCPMDRTSICAHCTPCGIMSGVGGAGTFS